jgi:hypothetical protein
MPVTGFETRAVTQQTNAERGRARRIGQQSARRRRGDRPARGGRARLRLRGEAHHEGRNAGSARRQPEPPRGREVHEARFSPQIETDRAQRPAAQGLQPRSQNARRIARPHQNEAGRIAPQFHQPRRMQPPGLAIREILPDPQERLRSRAPYGETERKAAGGGAVGGGAGVNLMQGPARQPAAQRSVQLGDAGGEKSSPGPALPVRQKTLLQRRECVALRVHIRS